MATDAMAIVAATRRVNFFKAMLLSVRRWRVKRLSPSADGDVYAPSKALPAFSKC
jgi:hypothetical protein